jgi:hypothetical protein
VTTKSGSIRKVDELTALGDRKVVFENNFIYEVSRKLHPLVKQATEGIGDAFKQRLANNIDGDTKKKIEEFFNVKSSIAVWLK